MAGKRGRPPYEPTDETRGIVVRAVACGMRNEDLCKVLQIGQRTLEKYFKVELETGRAQANAKIAEQVYKKALEGDNACMFFWLKCQAGWRETDVRIHKHTHEGANITAAQIVERLLSHSQSLDDADFEKLALSIRAMDAHSGPADSGVTH